MELLAACQGIDLRGKEKLGKGTDIAYNIIRDRVDYIGKDKIMNLEINKCEEIIKSNILVEEVEKEIKLN